VHLSSTRTAGLWTSLERIAAELQRQFVISYEGDLRSDGTVTIEAANRGIAVRGPTRIR
jgi:hypothetical protein